MRRHNALRLIWVKARGNHVTVRFLMTSALFQVAFVALAAGEDRANVGYQFHEKYLWSKILKNIFKILNLTRPTAMTMMIVMMMSVTTMISVSSYDDHKG